MERGKSFWDDVLDKEFNPFELFEDLSELEYTWNREIDEAEIEKTEAELDNYMEEK